MLLAPSLAGRIAAFKLVKGSVELSIRLVGFEHGPFHDLIFSP